MKFVGLNQTKRNNWKPVMSRHPIDFKGQACSQNKNITYVVLIGVLLMVKDIFCGRHWGNKLTG